MARAIVKKKIKKAKTATKVKTAARVKPKVAARKKSATKPLAVYVLLDRSGSMSDKWNETIAGINAYVRGLALNDRVKTDITFAAFDGYYGQFQFDILRSGVPAVDWRPVGIDEVQPRGWTPLYNGIDRIVTRAWGDDPERAIVVIMTDGYENASRGVTRFDAQAMLDRCRARGWQVVFLGANFDAFSLARSLGVSAANTLNIHPQAMNDSAAELSGLSTSYALRGSGVEFSETHRAIAMSNKIGTA